MNKDEFVNLLKEKLYYNDEYEEGHDELVPLMCSLVDRTPDVHHCVMCSIAESVNVLYKISDSLDDTMYDEMNERILYRALLPQIYIIIEEVHTLLERSGLPFNEIREKFPFIFRVKKLMNFEKHPKMKGFFQHPEYIFLDNSASIPVHKETKNKKKEDWSFMTESDLRKMETKSFYTSKYFCEIDIKKYYSRDSEEDIKDLAEKFCNEENILICLPTIPSLINLLSEFLTEIIEIYRNNPVLFEHIDEFAMDW